MSLRLLFICVCIVLAVHNFAAAQPSAAKPIFSSETDPDFVLRMPFRLARPQGSGTVTFQSEGRNTYRVELKSSAVELYSLRNGKSTLLAKSSATFSAANTLVVIRRGSLMRVALNGKVLFESAKAPGVLDGVQVINPQSWIKLSDEPRLQPTEEIFLTDDFMTTPDSPSHWKGVSGAWHVAGSSRPKDAADPFKFLGFSKSEALAINSDTRWFWNDYQVEASARAMDAKTAFGIVFNYRSPSDHYYFEQSAAAGKLRLWKKTTGKKVLLAQRPAQVRAGQWYRLAISTFGTAIAIYVDENLAFQVRDAQLLGGQVGLFAAGEAGAEFDDVRVQSTPSTALITKRIAGSDSAWQERTFATDPYMASWGNASSEWEPLPAGSTFQSRGMFYQSLDVALSSSLLTTMNNAPRLQEVVLFANNEKPDAGYRLGFDAGKITLQRAGKVLASAISDTRGLSVSVRSGRMTVANEERTLLSYIDRMPLSSGRVVLRFRDSITPADIAGAVAVSSPNILEYRFDAAPVDWQIESGVWQSTTRWACVPNWNFYGGRGESTSHGEPIATVWNKRGFGGDGWIEAFIAPAEGTSDNMHFAYPVNMNIAFGATGDALGSGYNLVYRAQDATTLLLRQGKVVAQSDAIVFPGLREDEMTVYYRLTETWQHIQIQREGGRIRVWAEVPGPHKERIERKLLLDYVDPQPLTGDRIALWTHGINGMSVARLRLSANEIRAPYSNLLLASAKSTLASKPAMAKAPTVTLQRRVNEINGGPFHIDLIKKPTTLGAMPAVRFDFRNTPNTTLGLYAKVNDQLFRADFLGQVREDGDAVSIGKMKQSTLANGLRRAEFDLWQPIREYFPEAHSAVIEELFLANLSTAPDQVGGLSSNVKGTGFEWRLVPVPANAAVIKTTAHATVQPQVDSADRVENFESSIGGWKRMGGEQGASLWRDTTTAASGKSSLRLYHRKLAGTFGAIAYDKPFDVRRWPKLSFAYRLDERVQLSLVFEMDKRWYEVDFTDRDHTWQVVGAIPNVQKDNQWHTAEVDLLGAAQRANSSSTVITKLFFADTGITNNLQNVFWNVDDFRFVAATPLTGAQSTSVIIDAMPASGQSLTEPALEVRLQGANQIDIETLEARVRTTQGTRRYLAQISPKDALTLDAKAGVLRWQDVSLSKLQTRAYPLEIELQANDLAGKTVLSEKRNYTVDPTLDKTAPAAPYVSYRPANSVSFQDFENGMPDDVSIRRAAWVLHDENTSATGESSARIVNLKRTDFFSAFLKNNDYDAAQYPMVAFDYRFEPTTWTPGRRRNQQQTTTATPQFSPYNLNLVSIVNGDMQIVKFIGGPNRTPAFNENSIGELTGVVADGEWRHASLNLGTLLRKRYPNSPRLYAGYFGTWATGPWGYMNPQGVSLWVDNVTFYSTKARDAAFRWKAPTDANGINGYSFALDRKADTVPDTTVDTNSTFREFKNLTPGTWYFHVRARDNAGNWSETTHTQIELTR